ncbi:MAG: hypothetical protein QW835_02040 [Candidatus Hadarchaeum sp.]|uniref:hypothetical protein n=1 Tax=Candidatus Hadarchaeum sp. TaxID=2883567 RepID=UPI003174792D
MVVVSKTIDGFFIKDTVEKPILATYGNLVSKNILGVRSRIDGRIMIIHDYGVIWLKFRKHDKKIRS